jgi:predicted  nucleic acid-binding Zn-ribbon protein
MRALLFAQLQEIDQQLARRVREREEVLAALGEHAVLRAMQEQTNSLVGRLKQERATSSDLQWDLEETEVRLRALNDQERDGPSDPLVARELAILHKQRATQEEQVLHQFERIAELEEALHQAEQQYAERGAAWAQHEPEIQARLDQLGQEIETLQTDRERVASQLPGSLLTQYDDLQRRHRGTALSAIHNRQCSVCHARLPAAVFDILNDPAALVRCPRCGRVVYLERIEEYED